MNVRRVLVIVVAVLAVAALAQAAWWWPQLPERVASHFDMADRVNGWMSRTGFLAVTVVLQVLIAGLFLGLPLLIERLPDALINVPHKDYWLAPERRRSTLAHMSAGLMAVGCATLLLLLVIFQGIFALNASLARGGAGDGTPVLELPVPFLALMGLYLAAVAGCLVWMLGRFRKPA